MTHSTLPADHPPIAHGKTGIVLVNLGTPDSTSWWDIRRYLKEFLSDQRVIEVNPILWQFILNGIILTFRPSKTAEAYKKVWMKETNESPLRHFTRLQAEELSKRFPSEDIIVEWAMRYGNPSIKSKLHALQEQGCTRLLVVPLYPQYSATTTATVCDEAFRVLTEMRWQPSLRIADPYHDHPAYIDALAQSVTQHIEGLDWEPDVILASFHGIPKQYFDAGDPYHCYCAKTTRLLREKLGMDKEKLQLTFQSRFGPKEWLQPYTDKTLEKLAQEGTKKVAVITPGFAADCIETLEEIAIEAQHSFKEAGGTHFSFIPCLNAEATHINLLEAVSKHGAAGWITD